MKKIKLTRPTLKDLLDDVDTIRDRLVSAQIHRLRLSTIRPGKRNDQYNMAH